MTCRRRSVRGNKFDPCQSVVVKCKHAADGTFFGGGWQKNVHFCVKNK